MAAGNLTAAAGAAVQRARLPVLLRGRHVITRLSTPRFSSSLTSSSSSPQDVAILGGGLTGLVTAHYLAELLPTARITLYEGSDRLGGWIDSEAASFGSVTAQARGGPPLILEAGARMVAPQRNSGRYDDLLFLDLVDRLDLVDALRVSGVRPAQYIYYPDHLVNVSASSSDSSNWSGGRASLSPTASSSSSSTSASSKLWGMLGLAYRGLTEPVFAGLLPSILYYMLPSRRREAAVQQRTQAARASQTAQSPSSSSVGLVPPTDDESIGSFAERQLGSRTLVDNLLSAVLHGIYGGDVWRLSVASSPFRGHWMREALAPLLRRYAQRTMAETAQRAAEEERERDEREGEEEGKTRRRRLVVSVGRVDERIMTILSGKYVLAHRSDLEMMGDLLGGGGVGGQGDKRDKRDKRDKERFLRLAEASTGWTQMGFAGGFGTLTDALARQLVEKHENVTLRLGAAVTRVQPSAGKVEVTTTTTSTSTSASASASFDKVLSTLSAPALFAVTGQTLLPALQKEHAVTIQVVNLVFGAPAVNRPWYAGFGYLIPQTVPLAQNPEAALGVIFDTDREAMGQKWDALEEQEEQEAEQGQMNKADKDDTTSFTVMLGGHYWDDYSAEDYPTPEQAVQMAEAVVRRHLGTIPDDVPVVASRTKLCRGCIPQHYVGHAGRMAAADAELAAAFGGRLAVAGGSFTATGPGVLPSIRAGRDIALRTAGRGYRRGPGAGEESRMEHVGETGLGRFGQPLTDPLMPIGYGQLPLRFGNGLGMKR